MHLASLLDTIARYTRRENPTLIDHLQPPLILSRGRVSSSFPYYLPDEVHALYAWHNGTAPQDDDPWERLFYYHRFLPFEEAEQEYTVWHTLTPGSYNPQLWPIFTFMGESYAVWCGDTPLAHGPIYFVYCGEGQVYNSLTHMLEAIHECYTTGAYVLTDGRYEPDEPRVAAIKAKWNDCRKNSDGTLLGDHP